MTNKKKSKYFGTDGFRGEANIELTSLHAYDIGRFLGWYYSKLAKGDERARILVGKDTRRSSYMLEYSIAAGITASGADAYMLHVITTPGVSYVTRTEEFDVGIMITASHNPYRDNGIKLMNRNGEKLDDGTVELVESYLSRDLTPLGIEGDDLPFATGEDIGVIVDHAAGRNRYLAYLISLASHSYKNLRIGLDCANGASWMIARSVFSALGARLEVIGDAPNGKNVNNCCGSTHLNAICDLVLKKRLDLAFAFDGDADRCIAIDGDGRVIDGDKILYLLAARLKRRDMLKGDRIVATVMSNGGLDESLERLGVSLLKTDVGDRFVYEKMQEEDCSLGGEKSGHVIIKKYATTGDGLLTAIMITEELCDTKSSLSKLVEGVTLYPQLTKNLRVKDKGRAVRDPEVISALNAARARLPKNGRIILRESGTEPIVRIMVECESESLAAECADAVSAAVKKGGHLLE